MARDRICYWLSIASVLLLSYSTNNAVAYQRPIHNAILSLAVTATLLLCTRNIVLRIVFGAERLRSKDAGEYALVARDETGYTDDKTSAAQGGRIRLSLFCLAVLALSLRLETYRRISNESECTIISVEIWLPLLLALYDSVRFQKNITTEDTENIDASVYESLSGNITKRYLGSRFRYVIPGLAVSIGCKSLLHSWSGLSSTYICSIVNGGQRYVPLSQYSGLVLDLILITVVWEHLPRKDGTGLSPKRNIDLWAYVMASTASIWMLIATGVYYFAHRHRYYVVLWDVSIFPTLFSIALQAGLLFLSCITTLYSATVYGVMGMAVSLFGATILSTSLPFLWTSGNPFPNFDKLLAITAMSGLYCSWFALHKARQATGDSASGPAYPRLLFIITLLAILLVCFKSTIMHYHPIDLLIYEADLRHQAYVNATISSGSLAGAVKRYQQRYHRNPPPGFDIWYEFAKNKGCMIIDEYDQIHEDLLPFWSLKPTEIRRLTWEIASNQWNEASGISIRNGTARVQDNVIPTHRWMLEGVEKFISSFAGFLPDMDLVFNINDEPRVAPPYDELQRMRQVGRDSGMGGTKSWSANRAAGWLPEATDFEPHNFRGLSFKQNFRDWGSISCPPGSRARRDHALLGSRSTVCKECVAPHSLGQFVSNWSLAADMCHQPDMAHMHGFYMSAAAFKPAYALKPVFSQSKPHGWADILYPSAWNYMDKVKYDPTDGHGQPGDENFKPAYPDPLFAQKKATLFWRGATSEGVSTGKGQWRGMTRQRLVHMINNATSTHPQDSATVLLPHATREVKWQYITLSGRTMRALNISTDVHIVDHIARCADGGPMDDCKDQEAEFVPGPGADFQQHWSYKYLFDLDGAGFSGRFLPFLQSRSLPFKSALFREWYDSRLTAWKHFVPVDLRLHGVWSTLVYFAGVDSKEMRIKVAPHEREAEMIASEGREWANKVLRKEDMEVYFFRLLLEWGRLTDDGREELGFVV